MLISYIFSLMVSAASVEGKTYLFIEGGNQNVFGILADVAPRKIVAVKFGAQNPSGRTTSVIKFATLDGMYFNNTIDIADESIRQFAANVNWGGSYNYDHNVPLRDLKGMGAVGSSEPPTALLSFFGSNKYSCNSIGSGDTANDGSTIKQKYGNPDGIQLIADNGINSLWTCAGDASGANTGLAGVANGINKFYQGQAAVYTSFDRYFMSGFRDGKEKIVEGSMDELVGQTANLGQDKFFFDSRPFCYISRKGPSILAWEATNQSKSPDGSFLQSRATCSNGWCGLIGKPSKAPVNNLENLMVQEAFDSAGCLASPWSCESRLYYPENAGYFTVTSGEPLYLLHLYPKLRWVPRDPVLGGTQRSFKPVSTEKMRALRCLAVKQGDQVARDPILTGFRSPVVADTASVLISAQFRASDVDDAEGIIRLNDAGIHPRWQHDPPIAVRMSDNFLNNPTAQEVGNALLRAFTYKTNKAKFYKDVEGNCGYGWMLDEKAIAQQIYTLKDTQLVNPNVPYCYSSMDDERNAILNGTETARKANAKGPCVLRATGKPYSVKLKRWTLNWDPMSDPLKPKKYDVSKFIWKGCPDGPTKYSAISIMNTLVNRPPVQGANFVAAAPDGSQYIWSAFTNYNRSQLWGLLNNANTNCMEKTPKVQINAARATNYIADWIANRNVSDPGGDLFNLANKRRKEALLDYIRIKTKLDDMTAKGTNNGGTNVCVDPFQFHPGAMNNYPLFKDARFPNVDPNTGAIK